MKKMEALLGLTLLFSGCGDNGHKITQQYTAELDSAENIGYVFEDPDERRYGGHTLLEAGIDTTFANPLIRQGLDYNNIIIKAGIVDSEGKILPRKDKNITGSNTQEINEQVDTSNAKPDGTRVERVIRQLLID